MPRVKSVEQIASQMEAVAAQLQRERAKLDEFVTERNMKIALLEQKQKVLEYESNRIPLRAKFGKEFGGTLGAGSDAKKEKRGSPKSVSKPEEQSSELKPLPHNTPEEAELSDTEQPSDVVHTSPTRAPDSEDVEMGEAEAEPEPEWIDACEQEHPQEPPACPPEPAADRSEKPKRNRKRKQPSGGAEGEAVEAVDSQAAQDPDGQQQQAAPEPKPKRRRRTKASAGDNGDVSPAGQEPEGLQAAEAPSASTVGSPGPVPSAGLAPVNDTEQHVDAEKFRSEAQSVAEAAQAAEASLAEVPAPSSPPSQILRAGTSASLYQRLNKAKPGSQSQQLMEEVMQTGEDVSFYAKLFGL